VKFLVDNPLSPALASALMSDGHDAVHVRDLSLRDAEDEVIFLRAAQEGRTIISADTDFATLLALRKETKPSVILFREGVSHQAESQAALLLANMPAIQSHLESGAVIVFDGTRMRVRALPIS
jgi:predicted nuclease of predicted toxin-antitoxin system